MLERYSRISLAGNSKITPPPVPVNDTGDADARTFQALFLLRIIPRNYKRKTEERSLEDLKKAIVDVQIKKLSIGRAANTCVPKTTIYLSNKIVNTIHYEITKERKWLLLGAAGPWASEVWTVTDVGRDTRLTRDTHAPHARHTRATHAGLQPPPAAVTAN
ncbi:hypothetical protein SFRURICE_012564 [Spodoptera frugiperda]|nr:hypothetical protein SFRURICE_012564 [Spodoptera frugiperda]